MTPLRAKHKIQIVRSFKIMELNIEPLEKEKLRKQYYKVSRKYHPDLCIEEYKDGNMFAKMKASYDFLRNNMDLINANIEALKDFRDNAQRKKEEEEEIVDIIREERKAQANEEARLDREERIYKCQDIIQKQTNSYQTIKNCLKIERAIEDLEDINFEQLEELKNDIIRIYDVYKPHKLLKRNYIVYVLCIILAIALAVSAIPAANILLFCIAMASLLFALILVLFCNRYKKNIVFYTQLTGKTLND